MRKPLLLHNAERVTGSCVASDFPCMVVAEEMQSGDEVEIVVLEWDMRPLGRHRLTHEAPELPLAMGMFLQAIRLAGDTRINVFVQRTNGRLDS